MSDTLSQMHSEIGQLRQGASGEAPQQFEPLLTTHYSPLTTHHSPLTTHRSPLTTHYSPLTTHCPPLTTHYSLPTTHHPLNTPHSSLGAAAARAKPGGGGATHDARTQAHDCRAAGRGVCALRHPRGACLGLGLGGKGVRGLGLGLEGCVLFAILEVPA